MEENGVLPGDRPPHKAVWPVFAYFAGLFLLGQLMGLLFEQLQASGTFAGFAKTSLVITRSLDVIHNRDDAIMTVWSLVLAALLSLPLGWVYTYTKAREGYDKSLVQSLIVMAMIVSGMMMLIQDHFSRALALVGVVSAVRFRTTLRDPKDAAYLLIAIGIGMGTGLQVYRVATWMTVVTSIAFLLLNRFRVGESPAGEAGFVELAPDKKKKKKKDKKANNENDVEASGAGRPLAIDEYAAIAGSIEDAERGVLRPNAVLVVETNHDVTADFVGEALQSCGVSWHLVAVRHRGDVATLEYLLRLDRDDVQLALAAKSVKERCGSALRDIHTMVLPEPKARASGAD